MRTIDDVYDVFSLGGMDEITRALHAGRLPWDPGDKEYHKILEIAATMALSDLMATMDFIFYWHHPVHGGPYIGVRWPESRLVEGIKLSLHDENRELLFTTLKRPDERSRQPKGMNVYFDRNLDPRKYEASVSVYSEFVASRRTWKTIYSVKKRLTPIAGSTIEGVHEVDWNVPVP